VHTGGELGQIQFRLGQVSIQTTERYLGCKQRIKAAVNDRIGIEPRVRSITSGLSTIWELLQHGSVRVCNTTALDTNTG
jgi:hypothetical protein